MSAILADPYRGFAINFSSPDKPDGHDLIVYDSPQSQLRNKSMSGLPFPSEGTPPSYGTQPQAVLPYPAPHTNSHHEPQSTYVTAHQMLPQQLPPHYGYAIPPSSGSRKRARSGSLGDGDRNLNRNIGIQQSLPTLPSDEPVSAPGPPDILYPVHNDHASSHPSSGHGFPSPISLPFPQQHHHHRLPPQALLHSDPHGLGSGSPGVAGAPPSVVGQPGMPHPAPRPRGPKLKFTPEEDALLVGLKEDKNLTWKQIADFFPGRTSGTLQVRYCTKLKAKDVVWTDEMVSLFLFGRNSIMLI